MEILVVTPHTDDFIYGVGGTLITHADDDIHIVAVSSIQQTGRAGRRGGVRRHDRIPRRALSPDLRPRHSG